ncbi:MAG: DNA cytosine methyltransferase, partial [Nitrospira sp.]|nr:DNA cytosine methyltransferase [Nitrospira sp.]
FPIWSDVETFNGKPWRGAVDIVSAGFPCQDISIAGDGAGIDGERSGQWRNVVRIVREVQPARIDLENSPLLVSRGLARVLGDLAALGFDARWGRYGGAGFGAPADGKRFWLVAHSTDRAQLERAERRGVSGEVWQPQPGRLPWWDTEPGVFRVGDGVAYRVDRLSAVGDGQFPAVAARAFHELGRQPSRAVDY